MPFFRRLLILVVQPQIIEIDGEGLEWDNEQGLWIINNSKNKIKTICFFNYLWKYKKRNPRVRLTFGEHIKNKIEWVQNKINYWNIYVNKLPKLSGKSIK